MEGKYAVEAIETLSNTSLSHYLHWRAELPRHVVVLDPGQTFGSAMQVGWYTTVVRLRARQAVGLELTDRGRVCVGREAPRYAPHHLRSSYRCAVRPIRRFRRRCRPSWDDVQR
jgi:hypothetical protein